MRFAALFPAVAAILLSGSPPAAAAAAKQRSILVLELRGDPSVIDGPTLNTITSTVSVSVSKQKGLNVLTAQDVKNLVDLEAQKQMLGCNAGSESCLAEVASAMGAELVLSGDVGKLGASYVINLALFDASVARSIGRETTSVSDLALLPQILDQTVSTLLAPITGRKGLITKTDGVSIPTVDMNALKGGGLKAINMQAETALELAMDTQDDANSTPTAKRDAWCSLAQVPGNNPYVGPAQKTCDEWSAYVVASNELEQGLAADYDTLAGFLKLKRKTKEQKLEAIDAFLQGYARLDDKDEINNVRDARRKVSGGDDVVVLPARASAGPVAVDGDGDADGGGGDGGGFLDGVGLLAFDFESTPHVGLSAGLQMPVLANYGGAEPGLAKPAFVLGGRFAWAFIEGGVSWYVDPFNGAPKSDLDKNGLRDDQDDNFDPDNDDDGVIDDVDPSPCGDAPDCTINSSSPVPAPFEEETETVNLLHAYAGLQTIAVGIKDITLLRPSVGLDLYTDLQRDPDIGVYVANTLVVTKLFHVRTYARFSTPITTTPLVGSVIVGVDLSVDYLVLLAE